MSAPVVSENAATPNPPEFPDSSTCKQSLQVAFTVEELEALPDDTILRATGRFAKIPTWGSPIPTRIQNTGFFTDCTIRPVPREWADRRDDGQRVFEVLVLGASRGDEFMVTVPELIESARVLS